MTGTNIIAFFHNLIDDTIDSDFALELLNNARNELEGERDWEFLKAEDSTKTFDTGNDYTTAKALPSDCDHILKVNLGEDNNEYTEVGFVDKYKYKDVSSRYFVDWANANMYVCGTISEQKTIHLFYKKKSADIEAGTEPAWPAAVIDVVSKMIGFRMAELYLAGLEADGITARMAPEHVVRANILHQTLVDWDIKLKLKAMAHQTPMRRDAPSTDGRINMDD